MAKRRRRNPALLTSLPPRIETRLQRQALAEARQASAPLIEAKRRALKQNRRAFRQDKRSIRGVAQMSEAAFDEAIAEAKRSGLKGQYLQQTLRELEARKAAVPAYVQAETATARQDLRANQADTRSQIFDERASMLSKAQTEFSADRDAAINDLQSEIKDRRSRRRDARSDGKTPEAKKAAQTELKTAFLLAQQALKEAKKKPWEFDPEDQEVAWGVILDKASGEGVSPLVAARAIEIIKRRRALEGRTPAERSVARSVRSFGG